MALGTGSRKSTPCDDAPCDGTFTLADGAEVPVARDRCEDVEINHCELAEDMCSDHWVMQVRARSGRENGTVQD